MKRRTLRRPTNGPAASRTRPANRCRAIIPVDGTAIRRKIKKAYENALRSLETARKQLDQFHQVDQPQYTRWLNTHFGALLTELRDLTHKLMADEELIFEVENEMMISASSYGHAYQRVMAFRENPEPPPPADNTGSREETDPFGARQPEGDAESAEDPLEAFFDEIFGEFDLGDLPPDKHNPQGGTDTFSSATAHGAARLKELYRALVRRLHPDTQQEMTAQKTEWWHQAQQAYESRDAEQLEVILTLCEIGDCGTTAHTSASLLQRITAQLKSSLREIKRQIAGRRGDPAWSFSTRTNLDVLAAQIRRSLTSDLHTIRGQCRQTQQLIAKWKAAAERLKPLRRRKRAPGNTDYPF